MSGDAAWAGDGADRTAAGRAPVNVLISSQKKPGVYYIGSKTILPLKDCIFSLYPHYAKIYSLCTLYSFFMPCLQLFYPFNFNFLFSSVLEPEPEGAETFGRSRYIEVSAPVPGSSSGSAKVVNKNKNSYWIGSSNELSRYSFIKKLKNPLFNMKAVLTGSYEAIVRAGAETFWKSDRSRRRN